MKMNLTNIRLGPYFSNKMDVQIVELEILKFAAVEQAIRTTQKHKNYRQCSIEFQLPLVINYNKQM